MNTQRLKSFIYFGFVDYEKKGFTVFSLRYSPGYIISRAALVLETRLHQRFTADGFEITADQWAILNCLWEEDGLYQSRLAELTQKDRHTITRILQIMKHKELIIRRPDPSDSRRILIYLSGRGRAYEAQLIPVVEDLLDKAF